MKHIQEWLLSTIVIFSLTACSLTSSDPENRTINEGQSDNVQEPIQMENDHAESVIYDNDQSDSVLLNTPTFMKKWMIACGILMRWWLLRWKMTAFKQTVLTLLFKAWR